MELVFGLIILGLLVAGGLAYYLVSVREDAPGIEPPREDDRPAAAAVDTLERPSETDTLVEEAAPVDEAPEPEPEPQPEPEPPAKPSFRERLGKARSALSGALGSVLGRGGIDEETWEDLEAGLIRADVGVQTTMDLLEEVRRRVEEKGIEEGEGLIAEMKDVMKERLVVEDRSLHVADSGTSVWLFVGVNGVGKTTTIGKLSKANVSDGRTVMLAAGDTFRAAAAEQLEMWADRTGADIVRGAEGADPASVIFDAIASASSKGHDLVMADTAGRLHNKVNLMEELRKVRRVAEKAEGQITEVLLVLDATVGQNGLEQARHFTEAVDVTGVVLSKLDGSAKGGIVLAVQSDLGIPVKYVGLGEGADDLVPFDHEAFVDALFE